MADVIRLAVVWLEERTGLPSACARVLSKNIPASAGWPEVFGSVVLFLFLVQGLTGILLAFNYAPTPGDAYRSIAYILRSVPAGRMIRGLHHWGASLMIVVAFIHMAQVFIYGAYKKPREVTWIVGVCLLLFTLTFGLTGYLLPWDNRAYWGTVVTTQIMSSLPVVGPYLTRLAGASNGIGVLTFSRFYAVHTMLLPAAMIFLIIAHVGLVLRHGVTPRTSSVRQSQKFFPRQAFRDVLAVFVAFVILFAAALFLDAPLERLADPTDNSYLPRPEWYFLFLFELLKRLHGGLEPVATVVFPTVAVLGLFLLPFVTRSRFKILDKRIVSAAVVFFAFAAWGGLTLSAIVTSPHVTKPAFVPDAALEWARLQPEQIAGIGYFRSLHCDSCHNLLVGSPKPGPNLALSPVKRPHEWLVQHFANPAEGSSHIDVSSNALSLMQLNALSILVSEETPESIATLQVISPEYIQGAQLYVSSACASCHKINGAGGGVGPPLNGLVSRRSKQWVDDHFARPASLSPGSIMPPFHFTRTELDQIATYLFSLPE